MEVHVDVALGVSSMTPKFDAPAIMMPKEVLEETFAANGI